MPQSHIRVALGLPIDEAEARAWMEEARFKDLQRLDPEPTAGAMIGRKA